MWGDVVHTDWKECCCSFAFSWSGLDGLLLNTSSATERRSSSWSSFLYRWFQVWRQNAFFKLFLTSPPHYRIHVVADPCFASNIKVRGRMSLWAGCEHLSCDVHCIRGSRVLFDGPVYCFFSMYLCVSFKGSDTIADYVKYVVQSIAAPLLMLHCLVVRCLRFTVSNKCICVSLSFFVNQNHCYAHIVFIVAFEGCCHSDKVRVDLTAFQCCFASLSADIMLCLQTVSFIKVTSHFKPHLRSGGNYDSLWNYIAGHCKCRLYNNSRVTGR